MSYGIQFLCCSLVDQDQNECVSVRRGGAERKKREKIKMNVQMLRHYVKLKYSWYWQLLQVCDNLFSSPEPKAHR